MVNNLSVQKINKEELVPYHKRVLSTPKSPEGIVYKKWEPWKTISGALYPEERSITTITGA